MLLSPVVPAIVLAILPVVSSLIVAVLVAARPGPSLPAARVLLVRRLLRLLGPIPAVTPASVLLLPGDTNASNPLASVSFSDKVNASIQTFSLVRFCLKWI